MECNIKVEESGSTPMHSIGTDPNKGNEVKQSDTQKGPTSNSNPPSPYRFPPPFPPRQPGPPGFMMQPRQFGPPMTPPGMGHPGMIPPGMGPRYVSPHWNGPPRGYPPLRGPPNYNNRGPQGHRSRGPRNQGPRGPPSGNQHPTAQFPPNGHLHNPNQQGGNRFNRPKQGSGKKDKVNKRDKAENNNFYCDTCDRGYKEESKFKEHTDSHEQCRVEGCRYIAAPKLVKMHYDLQHRTGMAKKIWETESKEDLQKWINERKKNFPTKATIEKKKQILAEKVDRGEVIQEQYFGQMRGSRHKHPRGGQGRGRDRGRGRGRGHDRPSHHSNQHKPGDDSRKRPAPDDHQDAVVAKDPKLDPMAYILDNEKTDTKSETKSSPINDSNSTLPSALSSLVSSYGDISDSDASGEDPPVELHTHTEQSIGNKVGDLDTNGGRKEENVGGGKKEPQGECEQNKGRQRHRRKRKKTKNDHSTTNNVQHQKSTLLQKLLAREIRHERNVLLQCIRYLVKKQLVKRQNKDTQIKTMNNQNIIDDEIWENNKL